MRVSILAAATAAMLAPATFASAITVSFNVAGTLGNDGLAANSAFRGATFEGTVDVDTDVITASSSNGINYALSGYDIDVTAVSGDVISFFGDGEEREDGSVLSVLPLTGAFNFFMIENIDDPATRGLERRLLRLNFVGNTNGPVFSLEALLAADPNIGNAASFELGLLQFSTSQGPTSVASATATRGTVGTAAVPLPAAGLLLLSGLAGFAGMKRRRKHAV